ncbi:MAG: radical SAM protein [Pseudomonadota bacterium]
MTEHAAIKADAPRAPFSDPDVTATGEPRAHVALDRLETLWFNTGTLCNIACVNCYIESSPRNDRLAYLTKAEVEEYLDEIDREKIPTREIGFTGGEPFMNPEFVGMIEASLERGFAVLVLTNAMRPMMRPRIQEPLAELIAEYGEKLTLRISLDHHSAAEHDAMRGAKAFERTLEGMRWLASQGARLAVAGRTIWGETDAEARAGFAALFEKEGFEIDAADPGMCVLFPEMDETVATPEITTACWGILDKSPSEVMCASSRMVIKRRGMAPSVAACTLLPYDPSFDLGPTLKDASRPVALNHPHCSKFCVLGGASCSA